MNHHSRSRANYQPIVVDFLDVSSKCHKLIGLHLLHLLELLLHLVVDILHSALQAPVLELLELPLLPLLLLGVDDKVDQHL